MRAGLIGTGAIANLHARAYQNIGFELTVCTDVSEANGRAFAERNGCEFVKSAEELVAHPKVDFADACTFPDYRLQVVELCAAAKKHAQVQKPMAIDLATARTMIDTAKKAGITLGVVSQHRFDESSQFLKKAIDGGRLGKILQADCYVKWWRSHEYYSRPIKGSWATEGGGALINQAIHQLDILRWLMGPVAEVYGHWQLAAAHKIESEDIVNAIVTYTSGATGVIQAATAFWPGYTERVEIHGTKGTAVISGDRLTTWDVENDSGDPAPLAQNIASGASDPMAISTEPLERQFRDFAEACKTGRPPLVDGEGGYAALELCLSIYESCRSGQKVTLG